RVRAVCDHHQPALAEIDGLGNNGVALIVLKPSGVHRFMVGRVNHNLCIELSRDRRCNLPGHLPACAIVIADHQDHLRKWARRAAGNGYVLRIEYINVAITVSRDRWLPLISAGIANPGLVSESRSRCKRRASSRKTQEQYQRECAGTRSANGHVSHRTSVGLEDPRGVDFILRVRESQSGMY